MMGVRGCGLPGLRAVRIGRNAPTGMASPTSRQGHGYRCLRCRRVIHLSFLLGRLGGFAEDCFFSSRRFDALPGSTECTAHGEPTTGDQPGAPRPRIEAIRWAEFAGLFRNTRQAFLEHERSKAELKALMPEDAKEAIGHGIRAKRAIIGSALGASLRAGRALSDQLEPQLAANEGRSALKGFDGNVALRLQDAIHLGAAGVHAFGPRSGWTRLYSRIPPSHQAVTRHPLPTIAEGWARRDVSLFVPLHRPLSQTHPGAAAVFVDELDAGRFESPPDGVKRQPPRFVSTRLKLAHRHDTDKRCFRQIRFVPAQ